MLISLRNDHKEHLNLLKDQSTQVLVNFCKLSIDYLNNGPNEKLYSTASEKLGVTADDIQKCVYGLVNLLMLSCQHRLSEADFRDSILTLGFNDDQEAILNKFFQSKKSEVIKILHQLSVKEPHFDNLEWRLEVVVASRCMLKQANPILTMDLSLKTQKENCVDYTIDHHIIQTDVNNLNHICNELETALKESKSRHCRKLQRTLMTS
ncbi:COMM domain-containing protein 2-like [Coccinella septempunctata]|uniref:COMM domain-containing protein 2-like n=1 Tax=Coccinella septempunctata TaxID=41139 RepID=UPI001D067EB0|nr:COMM domain-containing protein 2-like [Coccinella septempunctata]